MMAHPPDDVHGASSVTLDAARRMTARGWVVFPADHPDADPARCTGVSRACRRGTCKATIDPKARGKHPRVVWSDIQAPATDAQLEQWFGPDALVANVAVAAGPSRLLIVDEDEPGVFDKYAAKVGAEIPDTFTVTTGPRGDGRGRHWYFTAPAGLALGNVTGVLPAGLDVRGGRGFGGYVIGPGSQHWTGVSYTADDWDAALAAVPEWLIEALTEGSPAADGGGASPRGKAGESGTTLPTSDVARWSDAPRYGSAEEFLADFRGRCAAVKVKGGPFRHDLFTAARDGFRLLALAPYVDVDEAWVRAELDAAVWRVWHTDPHWTGGTNEEDEEHIDAGQRAAELGRWELTTEAYWPRAVELAREGRLPRRTPAARFDTPRRHLDGLAREWVDYERSQVPDDTAEPVTSDDATTEGPDLRTTDGNRPVEGVTESEAIDSGVSMAERAEAQTDGALADKIRDRVEWLDIDAEAKRIRAARDLVPVEGTDAVAFFSGPPPEYLVPGMVHRDGIAILFGAPHCGKSFLALDIALSFASGKPWAGGDGAAIARADGTPGVVHYVMAEAEGTNIGRGNAWFKHHGISPADVQGRFIPVTTPFRLTEAEVPLYVPAVKRDQPNLIVFDTKNAMYGGKESQGDDIAEMVRALRTIREAAGRCALLVIDHTGLNDPSRPRGSNAWEGASDSMIIAVKDKDTGHHKITTIRDRNAPEDSPTWGFRREPVMVGGRNEAVLVPIDITEHTPFVIPGWADEALPDAAMEKINGATETIKGGKQIGAKAKREAKIIYQLLRSTEGEALPQTRILRMINDTRANKAAHVKGWAVSRGCALLVTEGLALDVGTAQVPRYVVAPAWSRRELPE